MKYIKKFENENSHYKIGDYVKVDGKNFTGNEIVDVVDNNIGKIIDIDYNKVYPFEVEYNTIVSPGFKNPKSVIVMESEILRYATKDEIENYEINKNTQKYNL